MTKHIVAVIDRSGSMSNIAEDMNGGIRQWLGEVTTLDPDALLTSIIFDDQIEETNVRTKLIDVKPTSLSISPRGATALNDAIMRGLGHIKKDESALVFIVTDGQENASHEATSDKVQKRIAKLEKQGVTFQYLSASASAFEDAHDYGIASASTSTYSMNYAGTRAVSGTMTQSSEAYFGTDDQEDRRIVRGRRQNRQPKQQRSSRKITAGNS